MGLKYEENLGGFMEVNDIHDNRNMNMNMNRTPPSHNNRNDFNHMNDNMFKKNNHRGGNPDFNTLVEYVNKSFMKYDRMDQGYLPINHYENMCTDIHCILNTECPSEAEIYDLRRQVGIYEHADTFTKQQIMDTARIVFKFNSGNNNSSFNHIEEPRGHSNNMFNDNNRHHNNMYNNSPSQHGHVDIFGNANNNRRSGFDNHNDLNRMNNMVGIEGPFFGYTQKTYNRYNNQYNGRIPKPVFAEI